MIIRVGARLEQPQSSNVRPEAQSEQPQSQPRPEQPSNVRPEAQSNIQPQSQSQPIARPEQPSNIQPPKIIELLNQSSERYYNILPLLGNVSPQVNQLVHWQYRLITLLNPIVRSSVSFHSMLNSLPPFE